MSAVIDSEFLNALNGGVDLPKRSALVRLEPISSDFGMREGLLSFITRTANAHCVNPRRLVAHVYGQAFPEIKKLSYPSFYNYMAGTINGLGKYANLFVNATQDLAGHHDLRTLTMLPWANLLPFNGMGLLSKKRRWCSACISDWVKGKKTVYAPLIWSLDAYQACDLHGQKLCEVCPHCQRYQPYISSLPDLSICEYCHHSLIAIEKTQDGTQDESKAWVAPILKRMVAQNSKVNFSPTVEMFHVNLGQIIATQFNGSHRTLARHIGLGDYALKNWVTKSERPSFSQMLLVCRGLGVEPGVMASKCMVIELNAPVKNSTLNVFKQRISRSSVTEEERVLIGRLLIEQLDSPVPLCVGDIAKQRGVSAAYLKYWFPELCAQITERWRIVLRNRSILKRVEQGQYIESVVRQLLDAGIFPARRKVSEIIRREGIALAKKYHSLSYISALLVNYDL
jgi:hypothetical protein